jgi:hypothetical protein
MSGVKSEYFSEFIARRLNNNDRVSSFSYDPLLNKNSYTYNLTFPSASFDTRTPTRAVFAHPASLGTITELKDVDQPAGSPSEIVTFASPPLLSGASGTLLTYNGTNYKLYTFGNLPINSTRNYKINTYI